MTYMWDPKPDITAFELAIALRALVPNLPTAGYMIDEFPENVRRHFRIVVSIANWGPCEIVQPEELNDATGAGEG